MRRRENRFLKGCVVLCAVLILAVATGIVGMLKDTGFVSKEKLTFFTEQAAPVVKTQEVPAGEVEEKFYYQTLNEEEKRVYETILQGIRENQKGIDVPMTEAKRVNQIFQFVLNDFPDIFWCSGAAETTAYQIPEGGYAQICPEYTYEGETKEQMQRKINAETKAFLEQVQEIQSASEYDRIKYVYEYVIRTVDYVADASDSQNLFSALVGKESVCAGYARETQYLLEKLGVFCTYVTGTTRGQPHAWNLVRCEGNYYYVDTTWGDPVFLQSDPSEISEAQQIQYDYLCCNEEEPFRTHELDGEVPMPSCTSLQDNYYVREGCYYQRFDKERMRKQLNTEISAGKEVSVFKFSGKAAYEESREILLNNLIREGASNLAAWYQLSSARYSYQDDEVLYKITVYWQYE